MTLDFALMLQYIIIYTNKRKVSILLKEYTISQTAELLSISKDTLRYYDKIGLIKPLRGTNNYRFYNQTDILLLQYVEVMKYAGLSLTQIKSIMNDVDKKSEKSQRNTLNILSEKSSEIKQKILLYQNIERLLNHIIENLWTMSCPADMGLVDNMIKAIYESIQAE